MPLIRYPGSKAKLVEPIAKSFPYEMLLPMFHDSADWEYREPFFGSGAIGFNLLPHLSRQCSLWLNDADADLVCMWQSVYRRPMDLIGHITAFRPSAAAFYDFKARDNDGTGSVAERGFRKLALHRMSMSGFGYMSGGPIGGREQTNEKYNVQCRWNPERMKRDIAELHRLLNKFANVRITCGDFSDLLSDACCNTFVYLDPPYYAKGPELYRFSFSARDHDRLAGCLRSTNAKWALSYDDHPEIRRLYSWATFTELEVRYSNAVTKKATRPKNREVLITS